jgi:hypothetical protein
MEALAPLTIGKYYSILPPPLFLVAYESKIALLLINKRHEMTDLERDNVYKMILTRNRKRLEALKKKEQE